MKNPEESRIVTYQAKPESYDDLKIVHALLEEACQGEEGKAMITADMLDHMKSQLAMMMPDREDIDAFVRKACKELVICKAFSASNVFTHYVFAGTVPFSPDLYHEAFANAPGLEQQIMNDIASRYIPPLHGPRLTNRFVAQLATEKARRKS